MLLSVLSMLAEPNVESGADIEVNFPQCEACLPASRLMVFSAASCIVTTRRNSSVESGNRSEACLE